MKVARCKDKKCKEWHCCFCGAIIRAKVKDFGHTTEQPPLIGDYFACWPCFNKETKTV